MNTLITRASTLCLFVLVCQLTAQTNTQDGTKSPIPADGGAWVKPEAIQVLLKAGLPVDGLSRTTNRTALAMTATGGVARREGLKAKSKELNGMPLVMPRFGTAADYLAAVEILLAAGADVSLADFEGFTPLHHAVTADEVDVVRLLLAKGGKVNVATHKELTPLHLAAGAASPGMIELLLSHGATIDAVQRNQPSKYTPLMWAVDAGKVDNLKLLLQHGADPKRRVFDKKASALHMAAMRGHVAIVEILVAAGLAVDVTDTDSMTPLMVAVQSGHRDVCAWLIQHGADVNAHAINAATPLAIAAQIQNAAISQLLRQHGAK